MTPDDKLNAGAALFGFGCLMVMVGVLLATAASVRARRARRVADQAADLAQQADDRVTRAFDSLCTLSDAVLILRQHRAEDVASIADLSVKVVEHDDALASLNALLAAEEAAEKAAASLTGGERKFTGDCRDAHPDGTASVFLSADQRHERDRERYNARQAERREAMESEDKWALGRAEADKGQC